MRSGVEYCFGELVETQRLQRTGWGQDTVSRFVCMTCDIVRTVASHMAGGGKA